jgi:hypothetical protein
MAAMISFFQSRVVKIEQQLFFIAYVVCTFLFRGRILITRKFLLLFVVEWKKKKDDEKKKKRRKEGKSTLCDIIIVATIILRTHTHHYCGEQHNKYIRHIEEERFICYLLVLVSF